MASINVDAQSLPRTGSTLHSKAERITEILRREYGGHSGAASGNPTDCLIGTILSQHTVDRNSSRAFAELNLRYSSWAEVAEAHTGELATTIRVAGLANIKAARIQEALRSLQDRFGTMDLEFIKEMPMSEARDILRSLPGVGPKTAACVLLFSCGLPALPVDTHVHRLARRLGLISTRESAEGAHAKLEELVPPADVYDFHVNLIAHGRQVCHAQNPHCGECVLQVECDYFKGVSDG